MSAPGFERIEADGVVYAYLLRATERPAATRFYSDAQNDLQMGIVAHPAGYVEPRHRHMEEPRAIHTVQQALYLTRGEIEVEFYTDAGVSVGVYHLATGDAVMFVRGGHAIRALRAFEAFTVKQGPYLGVEQDQVFY